MLRKIGMAVAGTALFTASLVGITPAHATPVPSGASSIEVNSASLRPTAPPPSLKASFGKPMKGVKANKQKPPAPIGGGLLTRTAASSPYHYVGGSQTATNTGLYANMMINWSYTDTYASDNGAHNVAELDAETTRANGMRDIVEVGTVSDRFLSPLGNDEPRLFVGAWVNGVFQGYNTGFVPYTGAGACTYHPGDNMGPINGTASRIGIEFINTPGTAVGWWVSQGAAWCGYLPADPAGGSTTTNRWFGSGANFTSATKYQAFGEVASSWNEPCTDMGNGTLGNSAVSSPYNYNTMPSYISTVSPVGVASPTMGVGYVIPNTLGYKLNMLASGKTFYYGGPGWNLAGTALGTRGSC
jgi:hypothetical protein